MYNTIKINKFVLVTFVLVLILVLTACSQQSTTAPKTTTAPQATTAPQTTSAPPTTTAPKTTTAPTTTTAQSKYGGVLKLAIQASVGTPFYPPESDNNSASYMRGCFETLLITDPGGEVAPSLATDYEVNPAAKNIVLHLRKGVQFHDGTTFNAAAAKWNLDNMIKAKQGGTWTSVDVIDDYTIRLNLSQYTNSALTDLGSDKGEIMSPTSFEKNGIEWVRYHPIGTGPFKFVEYRVDEKIVFAKWENYWQKGKPYLDGIEYSIITDETVRQIAFIRGDLHLTSPFSLRVSKELKDMGYEEAPLDGGTYALFPDSKNADSPYSDKKVREAVSYAIDRDSIAKALGYGYLSAAYQFGPTPLTMVPNPIERHFDLAKAKQLLSETKYANGFTTTIYVQPGLVPEDYANAIAKMLAAVNIKATVEVPTAGRYAELRFNGWKNGLMAGLMGMGTKNVNFYLGIYFCRNRLR